MIVVSNTSPIISLATVGNLHLLEQLYCKIIIPKAVYNEIAILGNIDASAVAVQTFNWIETKQVTNLTLVAELKKKLDPGESEAIALAIELGADLLIIDEELGRKNARNLGINLIGGLGILIKAKRCGLLAAVKPVMDDLILQAGYWIDKELYDYVLQQAQENIG